MNEKEEEKYYKLYKELKRLSDKYDVAIEIIPRRKVVNLPGDMVIALHQKPFDRTKHKIETVINKRKPEKEMNEKKMKGLLVEYGSLLKRAVDLFKRWTGARKGIPEYKLGAIFDDTNWLLVDRSCCWTSV